MIGNQRQAIVLGVIAASWFLATVAIICRFWARLITRTRWQVNDFLMLGAYVTAVGLVVASVIAVTEGELGVPIAEIPRPEVLKAVHLHYKMVVIDTILLSTSAALANLSISHFYTTLFPHPWLFYTCRIQMGLVILFWLSTFTATLLVCRPLPFLWTRTGDGECFDIRTFWLWASIASLGFDMSNLILPMPILWGLKLKREKKIRLTVLFGLGFLICAITAFRIHYDVKLDVHDITWSASPILLFAVPEPCLGILAGCLPIMAPLFSRASSKVRASMTSRQSKSRFSSMPSKPSFVQQVAPARLSMSGVGNARFKKLPADLYPLTVLATKDEEMGWETLTREIEDVGRGKETGTKKNEYEMKEREIADVGSEREPGLRRNVYEMREREAAWPDFGVIKVEQQVKVESSRA